AGKHAARSVYASVLAGIAAADIGIDFVVRRRQIKLGPSPKHVAGEKHALVLAGFFPSAIGALFLLQVQGRGKLRVRAANQRWNSQNPRPLFHLASRTV